MSKYYPWVCVTKRLLPDVLLQKMGWKLLYEKLLRSFLMMILSWFKGGYGGRRSRNKQWLQCVKYGLCSVKVPDSSSHPLLELQPTSWMSALLVHDSFRHVWSGLWTKWAATSRLIQISFCHSPTAPRWVPTLVHPLGTSLVSSY